MEDILKTCLYQKHLDLGAKMMPFGGFDMPIEYTTIIEEHNAVRHAAGIFLTWAKFSSQAPIASDTSIIFSPTIFEMPKSVKSFTA